MKRLQIPSEKQAQRRTDGSTFYTPAMVSKRWAWHVESVRRAIRQRRIGSVLISRRRLVPISELQRIEGAGLVPPTK